ncbi:MAG TPA: LuxR C-terminal-related transcriptional regulator [Candidatus Acidoferrales bacterium]|nr:LuxR C-terminal-related transcriptional regulator [Candidatus Acidoferrales bacterium]
MCAACNAGAAERMRRKRRRDVDAADARRLASGLERAGDAARERCLYADASVYYADALEVGPLDPHERARISEKLAEAIVLGPSPGAARSVLDGVPTEVSERPESAKKAVDILLLKARERTLEGKIAAARSLLLEAIRIAEASGNASLRKLAYGTLSGRLLASHEYEEAATCLRAMGSVSEDDDATIQVLYYRLRGNLAAGRGDAEGAIAEFQRAVAAAQRDDDLVRAVVVWSSYGFNAMTLGRTGLALSCYQHAVFAARRFRIAWLTPFMCLELADMLFKLGDYSDAYEYLRQCLQYDAQAALLDSVFTENGLQIAMHAGDRDAIARCTRPGVVSEAFVSGEPSTVGAVAGAFAEWHVRSGRPDEARRLLHRAVGHVNAVATIWELPIAVARFGVPSDLPKARRLIESRAALPNADVARACLALFDAYALKRAEGAFEAAAREAIRRFETLGWRHLAGLARALLPAGSVPASAHPFDVRSDGESMLTAREREVAELVRKGMTNRSIAAELHISEHTVDSHVRSILGRLGLRSRYQIAGAQRA